jgi:hypothetical protein
MRNPFVQYLIGAGIFSIGLMVLLSSAEIAHSLGRFWDRWTGKLPRDASADASEAPPPFYRARLIIWRTSAFSSLPMASSGLPSPPPKSSTSSPVPANSLSPV